MSEGTMETKKVTCVICPVGCEIEVDVDNNEVIEVRNNKCKRGQVYASAEVIHPERILTTTVKVAGGTVSRVAVKSERPIPKELMFDCMKKINTVVMNAPVRMSDVVVENILGTGVNIIATRNAD